MEEYTKDFWGNAHKIAALLYRPIVRKQGDTYTIKPYTAKEDAEVFKGMNAELFGGCLIFFLNTRRELLHTLKSSLLTAAAHLTDSAISGDGTLPSLPLQAKTYSKWMQFRNFLSGLFSRTSPILKT